jgi:hypothetical protein
VSLLDHFPRLMMSYWLIHLFHRSRSLHRTPSQKTIATQLSIPISSSNLGSAANNADSSAAQYAAGLPSITTTAPGQTPGEHQVESSEAIKAHVEQIVAL